MTDVAMNYEVDNPEIKAVLRSIAAKIGAVVPAGWGHLLMIFEYGTDANPGATFYASSAERMGVRDMLRKWLDRQENEVNPDHPVTQELRTEWHKLAALLLFQSGESEARITTSDMDAFNAAFGDQAGIAVEPSGDVLTLRLVTGDEAERLAARERTQ